MIGCQSEVEKTNAEQWLAARGFKYKATYVTFDSKQKSLPAKVKDDVPGTEAIDIILLRLTLAKAFAASQLSAAVHKPEGLPGVVFGVSKGSVLQTKAAITYDKEISCLIRIRADKLKKP